MDTITHFFLRRGDDDTSMSSRAGQAVVVSVVFTTMATCLVSARLYTRIHIINRVEANDIMVFSALVRISHVCQNIALLMRVLAGVLFCLHGIVHCRYILPSYHSGHYFIELGS
jgi:hypothetical protein